MNIEMMAFPSFDNPGVIDSKEVSGTISTVLEK